MSSEWGAGRAYKRRRDGDSLPLESCLHYGGIHARNGIGKAVEIAHDEAVGGEVVAEDIEEQHGLCRDILWLCEVAGAGERRAYLSKEAQGV